MLTSICYYNAVILILQVSSQNINILNAKGWARVLSFTNINIIQTFYKHNNICALRYASNEKHYINQEDI